MIGRKNKYLGIGGKREDCCFFFFSFAGRIKDCRMNKSAVLFVVLLCGSAWAEITTIITNSTITTAQKWAAFETTTCMSSFPFYILCICNLFFLFLLYINLLKCLWKTIPILSFPFSSTTEQSAISPCLVRHKIIN